MENTEWLDKLKSHISCQGTDPARGQVRDMHIEENFWQVGHRPFGS